MSANWIDICNVAICYAGGQPIQSLRDSSEEARKCNLMLPGVRQEILSLHPWNCATEWRILGMIGESGKSGKPGWPYRYGFAQPENCLRVIRIESGLPTGSRATIASPGVPYITALFDSQRILVCDEKAPTLVYIADAVSASTLTPALKSALEFLLASRLAPPLSGGMQRAKTLADQYRIALSEAILVDAREEHGSIPRDDTYLRERGTTAPYYGIGDGLDPWGRQA
ncbi:hypothetical protein LJC46_04345 [Desulfovibrio sp. OttesenSCG-928-G15]|nr:hypothetical protein [Desulfovibrio sp. OttesenSCG-928-G15]